MILRAYVGVILTVLIWGGNVVAVKVLLRFFSQGETIGLRLGVGAAVLLVLALLNGGWPRWNARDWLMVAGAGVLGTVLFQSFFVAGIQRSPAGISGLANAVVPIAVVLLGGLVGQKPSRPQVAGVLVSLSGMLWLFWQTLEPGSALSPLGLGFLGLAALSWAAYTLANRPLVARLGLLPFVAFATLIGALPLTLSALPGLTRVQAPWWAWGLAALSGLLANVFAYLAWANGARVLGAARTSIWQNLAPLLAFALAVGLLGERFTLGEIGAAALTLLGVLVANWPQATAAQS
ncbi:EamA/RhaT family transporter [Deinococcus irradiatisoli]|uniref:EamA/RhaT family transporter n=1 Tax=Deinococcus irradiatisoli TaxID=2202254 RepID=A0A2Z3JPH3_9DEIO|nr:DMT family transporter [Deinococcus irradiatisoli]AWN23398.1 EamA/RhaT family transporter [Deinococcus irradiatisoli]